MGRPWRQTWCDLAFLHWSVPVEAVRPLVPEVLSIRQREGRTWVAVVPFRMEGIGWRRLPGIPGLSAFPEINVRLYVEYEGRPGVWFLSLEAPSPVAVWVARRRFCLPYHQSRIHLAREGREPDRFRVDSQRIQEEGPDLRLAMTYEPEGEVFHAGRDSLERWLTDLLRLYTVGRDGRIWEAVVDHGRWPLQRAEATIYQNDLLIPFGLDLSEKEPEHVLFSRRLPVRMSPLQPVSSSSATRPN